MLSHHRNTDERQDGHAQQSQPHAPESFHEGGHNPIIPPLGKMLELVEVIPDSVDLIRGTGLVAEPLPQTGLEDVLVDCGANRHPHSATEASSEIWNMVSESCVGC